jgi:hypothetical protein
MPSISLRVPAPSGADFREVIMRLCVFLILGLTAFVGMMTVNSTDANAVVCAVGYAQYSNGGPWDDCRGPWTFCWGYHVAPQVPIVRYPGYLYAPGRGIVNEACNLPTSACPNEQRDVNY